MLSVLQHYRATVNLRKCRFLDPKGVEFVGIDARPGGNSPARSKQDTFRKLKRPETWADLGMLIGIFGFYQRWLFNYEIRISPHRRLQAKKPKPGSVPIQDEKRLFSEAWNEFEETHQKLLDELREDVLSEPVLARPDPDRRFYLKTDWSKHGMGATLLQAEDTPEARAAEEAEARGEPCSFDKTRSGVRLKPITFISRRTTASEEDWHSHIGEAATGRWAMQKLKKWLLGSRFTWLADCSGLKRFFKDNPGDIPTSMIQRWRMELLQFEFDLHHRPADMLTECNMLSRYNLATAKWRQAETKATVALGTPQGMINLFPEAAPTQPATVFATLPSVQLKGESSWPTSEGVTEFTTERSVVAEGCFATPIVEALSDTGYGTMTRPMLLEPFDSSFPDGEHERHYLEAGATASSNFWEHIGLAHEDVRVDWYVACYHGPYVPDGIKDESLAPWVHEQVQHVRSLVTTTGLRAAMLWVPSRAPNGLQRYRERPPSLPGGWRMSIRTVNNTHLGGAIETSHEVVLILPQETMSHLPTWTSLEAAPSSPMELYLDCDHEGIHDALDLRDLDLSRPSNAQRHMWGEALHSPRAARGVNLKDTPTPIGGFPAFDVKGPAPSIRRPRPEEDLFNGPFGIWHERDDRPVCRPVRLPEVFRMLGVDDARSRPWLMLPPELVVTRARSAPGMAAMAQVFDAVAVAEARADETKERVPALMADPTPSTALPLPSVQQWKDATTSDHDLGRILQALQGQRQLRQSDLSDKGYWEPYQLGCFEEEDGQIFCYEQSRVARLRQLRVKVVPVSLRRLVIVACHSSPFGGHSGLTRTRFRILARYWWPGITRDVREGCLGCAHCNLSNAVSHENQLKLHTLACDQPFDVVFIDFWSPGDLPDKHGNVKILTYVDAMTGFAMGECMRLDEISTEGIANVCLSRFWATSVGLPRMIFVDADPLFCDVFVKTFQLLRIPVQAVSRGNHKAIRNENFHRYLNKVERINTADTDSQWRWNQGAMFAFYAWNASPVDGTDIPRCQIAIGREFPFPIDLSPVLPRAIVTEGQQAADHFEAASPLLFKQRELLDILNTERRRRHAELRNLNAPGLEFEPGDLVLVRKKVKSDASRNFSAKQVFKTRGPYRVLERINPNSHRLQKLPFLRGLGRKGRPVKEHASRIDADSFHPHLPQDGRRSRHKAQRLGRRNSRKRIRALARCAATRRLRESARRSRLGVRTASWHVERPAARRRRG